MKWLKKIWAHLEEDLDAYNSEKNLTKIVSLHRKNKLVHKKPNNSYEKTKHNYNI